MSLTIQFYTMVAMIAMGSFIGASMDTYHRFFKRDQRKIWLAIINDVLFWILEALLLFYILFLVNKGEIRFYIFLALLCGYACYQSLLKGIYLHLLERLIIVVKKTYQFFVRLTIFFLYRPIRKTVLLVFALFLFILKAIMNIIRGLARLIWLILKIVLYPVFLISKNLWNLLPPSFTIRVKDLMNKLVLNGKGLWVHIKGRFTR